MLFPQNADGETWGNDEYGLPVPTKAAGFEVVVPGYFQPRTNDYTAQITAFKSGNCDIVGGITYADDFKTFVNQCAQQGYKPKAITVAAALLFPRGVEALGDARRRHVVGSLVDAGLPVQVHADRPGQPRHRRHVGSETRTSSGRSRSATSTPTGKSCSTS